MSISPRTAWRVAAAAGIVAAASLAFWSTRSGLGLSPDSLKYLLLARSLASRQAFDLLGAPATHYPPGYPLLIAAIGAEDPGSLGRLRILHALLFALNIGLVMLAASRAGGRVAAILAALLCLGSPGLLTVHVMLWSEPIFLTLILGAALLLSAGERTGQGSAPSCAAACLAGAATVRYAGLAFVPAAALAVLMSGRGGVRRRGRALAGLVAGALLPLAAWLVYNSWRAGSVADRPLAFHLPDSGWLAAFLRGEGDLWGLGPHVAVGLIGWLVTLAAVIAGLRSPEPRVAAQTRFVAFAWASYPVFLLASMALVDADTPLDVRILAPLHVFAIVLVATAAGRFRAARLGAILGIAMVAVALHGLEGSGAAAARLAEGEGFASRYWQESETLAGLRGAPPTARIFTNGPEVVAAFVGGDVAYLPIRVSRVSLERRSAFESEMKALCTAMRDGGKVVYLDGITWAWEVPSAEQLQDACGLRLERRFTDGVVLGSAS